VFLGARESLLHPDTTTVVLLRAPSLSFFREENYRGKGGTERGGGIFTRLLVELGVMMATVMVMAVHDNHNLRLRRIGCCEAEDEHESKQNLFHNLV
jgi:hypothetical protein